MRSWSILQYLQAAQQIGESIPSKWLNWSKTLPGAWLVFPSSRHLVWCESSFQLGLSEGDFNFFVAYSSWLGGGGGSSNHVSFREFWKLFGVVYLPAQRTAVKHGLFQSQRKLFIQYPFIFSTYLQIIILFFPVYSNVYGVTFSYILMIFFAMSAVNLFLSSCSLGS